ncbi:MAG: hypothetical protein RL656_2051, partial [Bacteroidota bacterium]
YHLYGFGPFVRLRISDTYLKAFQLTLKVYTGNDTDFMSPCLENHDV